MILKARRSLAPLQLLFSPRKLTLNVVLCKSSQLTPASRFLATKDSKHNLDARLTNRETDKQGGMKIRQRKKELWDDTVDEKRQSFALKQRVSLSKSVFAAGTAKRTAEMLKKKAALFSQDVEDPESRPKGAGWCSSLFNLGLSQPEP